MITIPNIMRELGSNPNDQDQGPNNLILSLYPMLSSAAILYRMGDFSPVSLGFWPHIGILYFSLPIR
jgi:hypothetical protein